jgi:hypothetical protein
MSVINGSCNGLESHTVKWWREKDVCDGRRWLWLSGHVYSGAQPPMTFLWCARNFYQTTRCLIPHDSALEGDSLLQKKETMGSGGQQHIVILTWPGGCTWGVKGRDSGCIFIVGGRAIHCKEGPWLIHTYPATLVLLWSLPNPLRVLLRKGRSEDSKNKFTKDLRP